MPLDDFDRQILAILQKDNLTPHRTIAARVHLSAAAVQRRIRRLNDNGIIRANVAVVDPPHCLGMITLIVTVTLETEKIEWIEEAKRNFLNAPQVQQCYYVTGDTDFVMIIVAASMADFDALARKLFYGNNNVKRFNTFLVTDPVKAGLEVAL